MTLTTKQVPHTANSECPIERTLTVLRDDWSLLIIRELLESNKRFNELKRSVEGISAKVLAERLNELREAGVVERKVEDGPPVSVSYSLSEKGRDFNELIENIRAWGRKWMPLESERRGRSS